jgi:hypothetical protein
MLGMFRILSKLVTSSTYSGNNNFAHYWKYSHVLIGTVNTILSLKREKLRLH